MKITIWGDYACPFCYIGETLLEKGLREGGLNPALKGSGASDVTIDFRAYELDPEAPEEPSQTMLEHFMASHELTEDKATAQMERIAKMASRAGIACNLEGVKVCSTLDAQRLLKYAIDQGDVDKVLSLHFALFRANFVENARLSDRGVLCGVAERCGFDRDKVREMLESGQYADEVRKDEKEYDSLDAEYVPYLLFDDGSVLQGVISIGAIRKALASEASGSEDEPQQLGLDSCGC